MSPLPWRRSVRHAAQLLCFMLFVFCYWKSIVQTSNQIFESVSIKGVDDNDLGNSIVRVRSDDFAKSDVDYELTATLMLHDANRNNTLFALPIIAENDTDIEANTNTNGDISNKKKNGTDTDPKSRDFRFYILPPPDITRLQRLINQTESDLLAIASEYYRNALAEESAEMWLHRGFERLSARIIDNPKDADAYIVVGYCHLYSNVFPHENLGRPHNRQLRDRYRKKNNRNKGTGNETKVKSSFFSSLSWVDKVPKLYRHIVIDPSKPHLILAPTWNSEVGRRIGLHSIVSALQLQDVPDSNLWSVGFERNPNWQPVSLVSCILPIPYVVRMTRHVEMIEEMKESIHNSHEPDKIRTNRSLPPREDQYRSLVVEKSTNTTRLENSIFFVGDPRPHAKEWAGCSRSNLIDALRKQRTDDGVVANMDIRLVHKTNRVNHTTYRERMRTNEYCLVLCGDTPSSRTLTSAVVEGCIPVRVGSRLRGLCDPPCHEGFGWNVTGSDNPHLPFEDRIPWHIFPEINEAALLDINGGVSDGRGVKNLSSLVLQSMFKSYGTLEKKRMHALLNEVRPGFIYGYGDPVLSQDFGDATLYIWESFVAALRKKQANE